MWLTIQYKNEILESLNPQPKLSVQIRCTFVFRSLSKLTQRSTHFINTRSRALYVSLCRSFSGAFRSKLADYLWHDAICCHRRGNRPLILRIVGAATRHCSLVCQAYLGSSSATKSIFFYLICSALRSNCKGLGPSATSVVFAQSRVIAFSRSTSTIPAIWLFRPHVACLPCYCSGKSA